MSREELIKIIDKILKNQDFQGCKYYLLGNDYYIVFTNNEDCDIDCKIAFSVNYTKSSYRHDWVMPEEDNEKIICPEWIDLRDCEYTAEKLADEILDGYQKIINYSWAVDD